MARQGKESKCAGKTGARLRVRGTRRFMSSGRAVLSGEEVRVSGQAFEAPRGSEVGKSAKDLMDFDSKDPHQSTMAGRRKAVLDLLKGRTEMKLPKRSRPGRGGEPDEPYLTRGRQRSEAVDGDGRRYRGVSPREVITASQED